MTTVSEEPAVRRDLKRKALTSFVWSALSFGLNRFAGFVATLVLARLLMPADFGVVTAAIVLVSIFEMALDLGVGAALIYEQEEGVTPRVQTAFTLNMGVAVLLTAAGMAAAGTVAQFFNVSGHTALFRVVFLYLVIRALGQIHDSVLKRDLQFRRRTAADVARAVVRIAVSVTLAVLGYGAWALVWGLLAGELAATITNWVLVPLRPSLHLDRSVAGGLLKYGLAVVALKGTGWLMTNSDYIAVGRILGPSALGIYGIAYRLPELVVDSALWLFASIAFPVYSKAREEGMDVLRHTMLRALMLTTMFAFPAATGLALVSRDAIWVFFSPRWAAASVPMSLIALGLGVYAASYASGDVFPAIGKPGLLLKLDVPLSIVLVTLFMLAAPHGIAAVGLAHLCFFAMYGVIRLVVASRQITVTLRQNLAALWPGICMSLGIAVCALPVRLLTGPGLASLAEIVAAGLVGGLLAFRLCAPNGVAQVRDLVFHFAPGLSSRLIHPVSESTVAIMEGIHLRRWLPPRRRVCRTKRQ